MQAIDLLCSWPKSAWANRKLLVGVSGGADSVALLLALAELAEPGQVSVAHFNHGWRGAASDADQQFVLDLCNQLNLVCHTNAAPVASRPVAELNQNDEPACVNSAMHAKAVGFDSESQLEESKSEEVARSARYDFFINAAYGSGVSYVVTGHTADDRVETLLHNLFRGSGLAGAASLKQFRKLDEDLVLVRPLITQTRQKVLEFLAARGQAYRSDASNDDQAYARNYIRGHLLPAVRVRYPAADAGLLRFSELVEETVGAIEQLADAWLNRVDQALAARAGCGKQVELWRSSDYWVMPAGFSDDQPWSVVQVALRRLWLQRTWPLQAMDRARWESLRSVLQRAATPGSSRPRDPHVCLVLPGGVRVESAGDLLAIGRPVEGRSSGSGSRPRR